MANDELVKFGRTGDKVFSQLDKKMSHTSSSMGSLFNFNQLAEGIGNIKDLVGTLIDNPITNVTSEFQGFDAALTNMFSSAKASGEALDMLRDFAANTPYQLNELTESFVKFSGRGIVPAQEGLTALGDFASTNLKSFDQLTEAVLDASNPERWKEFGVEVSKANGMATLSWRGHTATVKDNAAEVYKAIVGFGQMEGVAGSMAGQSKTWSGQISNMKDNLDSLFLLIGNSSGGLFDGLISGINKVIDGGKFLVNFFTSNAQAMGRIFSPLLSALTPIWDAIMRVGEALGLAGDKGTFLQNVFNAIGNVISYLAPIIEMTAGIIAQIIDFMVMLGKEIYSFIQRNEWLQKTLSGLLNAALSVFRGIASAAKNLLGGVGDLIQGIFTADIDKIKSGVLSLADSVKGTFTLGKDAAEGFMDGYEKGFDGKDFFANQEKQAEKGRSGASLEEVRAKALAQSQAAAQGSVGAGIAGVKSDAAAARNVTVNIQKVGVDNLTFQTTNLTESTGKIKDAINEALVDAVRDAEYIL